MALRTNLRSKKSAGKKVPPISARTIPFVDQKIQDEMVKGKLFVPQQLNVACGQSVGKQRDHNEDSLFTFTITLGNETNKIPLGLYLIADGMGGHQHGEIASNTAVRTVAGLVLRKFIPFISEKPEKIDEPLQEMMRTVIHDTQLSVRQSAPDGGTTLTAALVLGTQVTITHIGDSRAYMLHHDLRMEALTRDHSLAKRLEELGQITAEEAAVHPHRNVLYRALGQGELLEPDILTTQFPQPGYILLCTDGLWGVLTEDEIVQIIHESPNIQVACQGLVEAANEAGGPDNISVILVQLLG